MKALIKFAIGAFVIIYAASVCAATKRFVDHLRNLSFGIPSGEWKIEEGLGDRVATLKNSKGAKIILRWIRGNNEKATRETLINLAGAQFKGAQIISIEDSKASFESFNPEEGEKIRGEIEVLPAEEGFLAISCVALSKDYLDFHFMCRDFVAGIDLPAPQSQIGKSFSAESAALAAERAKFAILDGRAGCPKIADEAEQFSKMAMEAKNKEAEKYFARLASILKKEKKYEPQDIFDHRRAEFFRKLGMARLCLEDGDADCASKYLKYEDAGSQLAAALNIWAAGLKGDVREQKRIEKTMDDGFCGESGALALYHLGLSESDPKVAERRFLDAIEADPSFKLPYIALVRAGLKNGSMEFMATVN